MAITIESVPFGRRAFAAVADAVALAQGGDRLAAVTVVVPTNTGGVMLRRWLGRHGGLAGVQFVTMYRLAEQLAGSRLASAGRRPITNAVMAAALQRSIGEVPGPLRTTSPHPATLDALARLHRELRELDRSMLDRLSSLGSPLARAVHDVHRHTRELLGSDWHDEGDLLDAARAALSGPEAERRLGSIGPIVVALPQRLTPSAARLLRAIAERIGVHVVVGLADDDEADAPAHALASLLTPAVQLAALSDRPRLHIDVLDVTDADDEVRAAVRELLVQAQRGTPFDRMALLFTAPEPYLRTLAEQLDTAGLPWNGSSPLRPTERMATRTLLAALDLDRRGWRLHDVFSLLAGAPITTSDGSVAPVAQWERVARDAGVRHGADWDDRLARYAEREQQRHLLRAASEVDDADDLGTSTESRRARAALDLRAFVLTLRGCLGEPTRRQTWHAWSELTHDLTRRLLGGERLRRRLPSDEQRAFDQLEASIDRLAGLDAFLEPVDIATFRDALSLDLERQPNRHSHVGRGVTVGPLSTATLLDADVVVVLGAVDGAFPWPVQPDPLLGETDRRLAGLPERPGDAGRADQRRAWLAALATCDRLVVGVARGDLRRSAVRRRTAWLDELLGRADIHDRTHASHLDALATTGFPVHDGEFIGRALLTHLRSGGSFDEHDAVRRDDALNAGLTMLRARSSPLLTAFDGDLSSAGIPSPFAASTPIAPTRLERWATCPHAYFMRHVLGVTDDDAARDALVITPLDKGSLVHEVLERFARAIIDAGGWSPDEPWSPMHRALAHRLLDEVADERSKLGLTGHPSLWAYDLARLHADLDVSLSHDDVARATHGRHIVGAETTFGEADSPWRAPVIRLAAGRQIAFKGAVDRVDATFDGSVIVTDYKTGKGAKYQTVSPATPTGDGTLLQLGVYAAAATQAFALPLGRACAEYRFVERSAAKAGAGFALTDDTWAMFTEALTVISDGIADGLFPARPGPPVWQHRVACRYCDPDGAGTGDRHREWLAKRSDPRLGRYLALIGDSGDDESDSDA